MTLNEGYATEKLVTPEKFVSPSPVLIIGLVYVN